MHKYLLAIGATLLLHSCSDLNKEIGMKDDNPIEQAVEEVIKEETGIVIDFTPAVTAPAKPATKPAVKVKVKK